MALVPHIFRETSADTILAGEAKDEDGNPVTVLLHASLDTKHGGIRWDPMISSDMHCGSTLAQLRTWYPPMLNDKYRAQIYDAAITSTIARLTKKNGAAPTVLDLGSGTGLLSMMAVRAGAREVHGCDTFPGLSILASSIASANLREPDTCRFHGISSLELDPASLPDGGCDLVISELLDHTLLSEGAIPSIRDARIRGLLRPGAPSIPASGKLFAMAIEAPSLRRFCDITTDQMKNSAIKWADPARLVPVHLASLGHDLRALSPAVELGLKVDFADLTEVGTVQRCRLELPAIEEGKPDAVAVWWELILDDEDRSYSTAPGSVLKQGFQNHWSQCVWLLHPDTPPMSPGRCPLILQAACDDITVWFVQNHERDQESTIFRAPDPKGWPAVATLPRMVRLFDADEAASVVIGLGNLRGKQVLDISEGSWIGTIAVTQCDAMRSICFEERPAVRSLLEEQCLAMEERLVCWAGADSGEPWQNEWGKVDVLCGDGYGYPPFMG